MLRDYRWQILALVGSMFIFGSVVIFRLTTVQPSVPDVPVTINPAVEEPTSESHETPEVAVVETVPTPVPEVTSETVSEISALHDSVVTFREGMVGSVQRLNPIFSDLNPVDRDITALIFEGLTRINEYGEPVGALARDWVVSGDGLEYVFILRDDVYWHDGLPFTADDVAFTASLLSSRDYIGPDDLGALWRSIETQKLGDHLVRFRLTQPLSSFPSILTIGILPEHALRGTNAANMADHPFNLSPIGTGPYQLEAFRSTDGMKVDVVDLRVSPVYRERSEAAENYAIDRVRFQLYDTFDEAFNDLRAGEIDGLAARNMNERPALVGLAGTHVYTQIAPAVGVLIFNWDEPEDTRFFQDQRVRVGLLTGLNRTAPIEGRLSNKAIVADSPLLPNTWAHHANLNWPQPDANTAATMLQTANIQRPSVGLDDREDTDEDMDDATGSSDRIFEFRILTREDEALRTIAQEFATQWSQLNLDVAAEVAPEDEYWRRLEAGEFDAAIVELPLGADPDVYAYWHVGQAPDGNNYGAVSDDRISDLLERARRDTSGINRIQHYHQFQELFIQRGIAIPLYYPLFTYVVRNEVAGIQLGFVSTPADRMRTIARWRFE